MKKVLVLGGLGFTKEELTELGEKQGIEFVYVLTQDLRCVIKRDRLVWKVMGTRIKPLSAIWVRGLFSATPHRNDVQQADLVARFLYYVQEKFPHIKIFDLDAFNLLNKQEQLSALAKAGIAVPETHVALTVNQGRYFPFPAIVKPVFACDGKGIELLEHSKAYRTWVKSDHVYFPALVQEWIPNTGDYRVLIVGDEVITCVKRTREEGILNNPTRSVKQELVDLDSQTLDLARRAVMVIGLDIAGVDLIQHEQTGEWYVLEVNQGPDLTRITAAGVHPLKQIVKFIAKTVQSS